MPGRQRIRETFARLNARGQAAFMPYMPVGYPSPDLSPAIFHALVDAGADLIEVGVPFSDPLADGPTIQAATQQALAQGVAPADAFALVRKLRAEGVTIPLILMGYVNPILAYGMARYVADAAAAGADGFIVPDLPPDEAGELEALAAEYSLAVIHLVAPTSTSERQALAAAHSSGFLYLVSVTGITGARDALPPHLADFVARVRSHTDLPLAVGFGIGAPDQVRAVAELADGVVVGSALVKQAGSDHPVEGVKELASSLARAAHEGS
ncbi:MAG TPA: tryptophan synthase subunit alpha [Anaerolineae bacterium]|nr:tryptophan synthase subunit alpha [Caldilineae bacterium]HID34856.1 tryptophan synthase subunit alpha [Anaerolineae bacterium]HIQ11710.1 tryptophan synthase subunit alpha [Caldilineales bacterium]